MIQELTHSLPDRNLVPANELVMPIQDRDQKAAFNVFLPGEKTPNSVAADPLGPNAFGLRLNQLNQRGTYRVERVADSGQENGWSQEFALNGPANESQLTSMTAQDFKATYKGKAMKWLDEGERIALAGGVTSGHRLWKVLLALAIGCLLIEMLMLRESRVKEQAA